LVQGQIVGGASVQTNSATNITNYQATLNGYLGIPYLSYSNYVYFQWGTNSGYGNQTPQQYLNNGGSFSQIATGLAYNTTYHFRAVAQTGSGTIYGQDMTFYTGQSNSYYGNGSLSAQKQVINLTSGVLSWQSSVNAKPGDILSFAITLQNANQDMHNVIIRDLLPANLIYRGNLTINTNTNYGGDIASGVNIGTIYANQPIVVAYQVQVAPAANFVYGITTLTNNATITSTEAGTQTASATVVVSNALVYGASTASTVSTGLTNNFLSDSFFLPLLLLLSGLWFYFSGEVYVFADKLKSIIKK